MVMAESLIVLGETKQEKYKSLLVQLKALVELESDFIANVANMMSALKYGMHFFWVGIYLVKKEELVLGPFQGTLACTRIKKGKGVCGKSWEEKQIILVEDVTQFPGHIACSAESKSEIVLPCFNKNNEVFAILDVDSNQLADFDETDKKYLQQVVQIIERIN